MHRVVNPKVFYFGTPVVLVSTTNPDGSPNLAPMSSAWWLGRSCMLGLGARSQTTENLRRGSDLVLNLVDPSLVEAVDRLALLTGSPALTPGKRDKGYRVEPDKFGAARLDPHPVRPGRRSPRGGEPDPARGRGPADARLRGEPLGAGDRGRGRPQPHPGGPARRRAR